MEAATKLIEKLHYMEAELREARVYCAEAEELSLRSGHTNAEWSMPAVLQLADTLIFIVRNLADDYQELVDGLIAGGHLVEEPLVQEPSNH